MENGNTLVGLHLFPGNLPSSSHFLASFTYNGKGQRSMEQSLATS